MIGRINIEPDHVLEFGGESRVVGQLEIAHSMGLEAVRAPDALHRANTDPDHLGHGRPCVTAVRRWLNNCQELKQAIESICELNHELLPPERPASKARGKRHD